MIVKIGAKKRQFLNSFILVSFKFLVPIFFSLGWDFVSENNYISS